MIALTIHVTGKIFRIALQFIYETPSPVTMEQRRSLCVRQRRRRSLQHFRPFIAMQGHRKAPTQTGQFDAELHAAPLPACASPGAIAMKLRCASAPRVTDG
ncbi:hypothetical protein [Burkholderia sp. IDO3]|uniref:hypothetical protein n=1 Tax=Burkholderia sp. IDO3 TaxID=1705310 RepID=UPI001178BA1A|nr:hypothetical protein [Burkholderia sp. IDO3]